MAIGTGTAVAWAIGTGLTAGATVYGHKKNSKAADTAARYQIQQANYAAELEAKAAAEQLAFLKEQEANRKTEWDKTQQMNLGMYREDVSRQDRIRGEDIARREPFRKFSLGALGQLSKPIYQPGQYPPGSLGALRGK